MHWKESATPAGRSWWKLECSAPGMGVPVLSSLLPTCRANKGGLPDSHGRTDMWGRTLMGAPSASLDMIAKALDLPGRNLLASIYENMMGFPVGWLNVPAKPTETPCCLNSPKP